MNDLNPTTFATALVLISTATITTLAEDAVQWTKAEGGNGHWYQLTTELFINFEDATSHAQALGAHLVTMTSAAENSFVAAIRLGEYPPILLGAYQDFNAADYSEPTGGWRWVTGEPWDEEETHWHQGEPNNGNWDNEFGEHYLSWWRYSGQTSSSEWNDVGNAAAEPWNWVAIIEWSADCNNDGIVDYGQILNGTLTDDNDNGVPDICDPTEWQIKEGGNGHWYQFVRSQRTHSEAAAECTAQGGYLIELESEEEALFVRTLGLDGAWIGLSQDLGHPDYFEPDGGWFWGSGTVPIYTNWRAENNEPNNFGGVEHFACMVLNSIEWNDAKLDSTDNTAYFIEWSADCNKDGIVDYGQILDGTLVDTDQNGVPDWCDSCTGDVNGDGTVDAADLGALLALWGTNANSSPRADANRDGTVDAADLGLLLGYWGVCP